MSKDCRELKNGYKKKNKKAKKAVDGDDENLVSCVLTSESKKLKVKKNLVCREC